MSAVTKVEIFPVKAAKGKIMAFGKITINDEIVIDGIKVIHGSKGLFVGMPSTKSKEGTFSDVVYITSKDLKNEILKKVIDAYKETGSPSSKQEPDDDLPF